MKLKVGGIYLFLELSNNHRHLCIIKGISAPKGKSTERYTCIVIASDINYNRDENEITPIYEEDLFKGRAVVSEVPMEELPLYIGLYYVSHTLSSLIKELPCPQNVPG